MPGPFRHPNHLCLSLGIGVNQFHPCILLISSPSPPISSMCTLYSLAQCPSLWLSHFISPQSLWLGIWESYSILRNPIFCFNTFIEHSLHPSFLQDTISFSALSDRKDLFSDTWYFRPAAGGGEWGYSVSTRLPVCWFPLFYPSPHGSTCPHLMLINWPHHPLSLPPNSFNWWASYLQHPWEILVLHSVIPSYTKSHPGIFQPHIWFYVLWP